MSSALEPVAIFGKNLENIKLGIFGFRLFYHVSYYCRNIWCGVLENLFYYLEIFGFGNNKMHRNPLINFLYKLTGIYPTPVNLSFCVGSPKIFVPIRFHGSNNKPILSTVKLSSSSTKKVAEKATFYIPSNRQVYLHYQFSQSTLSSKNIGFYPHNSIPSTVAPFKASSDRYNAEVMNKPLMATITELSPIAQSSAYSSTVSSSLLSHITSVNSYNTMGLSMLKKELSVSPKASSEDNPRVLSENYQIPEVKNSLIPSIKNPGITDPVKNVNFSGEELLKELSSISSPPPSPFVPENCTQEQFVLACNIYAHIYCAKQGMPLPIATIIASLKNGTPSMNIKEFNRLVKVPYFKDPMNFIHYIPEDHFNTLDNPLQKKLSELTINNVTNFFEIAGAGQVNKNLLYPLKFNTDPSEVKSKDGVENLTNQRNPDFLRQFPNPIWGIKTQAYDQKSYSPGAEMKNCNHLRVTTDKLGELTTQAKNKLETNINLVVSKFVQDAVYGDDKIIAEELSLHLSSIQEIYDKTNNPRDFNKSYNKIRDHELFGPFLIKHKIPMNLVTQVSLENFNLQENHIQDFNSVFKQAYYSPNSPVVPIIKKVMDQNNNSLSNLNHVYNLILEAVFTPPTL